MTGSETAKIDILARLEACPEAALPMKARQVQRSLIAKLESPVRLGVFGLPEAGKRRVVNALFSETIANSTLPLPSFEVSHGATAQTEAVLPDGDTVMASGYPSRETTDLAPMFLKVRTPAARLPGCTALLVSADGTRSDLAAALTWASTRVDVSIWISRAWTEFERDVWAAAPDALRNHAILLMTGPSDMAGLKRAVTPNLFEAAVAMDLPEQDPSAIDSTSAGLSQALAATIDEATTQDVLAAEMFLHRYAPRPVARTTSTPSPVRDAPKVEQAAPEVIEPPATTPAEPDPEAHRALARAFQSMRRSADALRLSLPSGPCAPEDLDASQSAMEAIFEDLAARVCDNTVLEATWPGLCADVAEARDLALLMRIEGGAGQLEDAAMLLLQLRNDMEVKLAA